MKSPQSPNESSSGSGCFAVVIGPRFCAWLFLGAAFGAGLGTAFGATFGAGCLGGSSIDIDSSRSRSLDKRSVLDVSAGGAGGAGSGSAVSNPPQSSASAFGAGSSVASNSTLSSSYDLRAPFDCPLCWLSSSCSGLTKSSNSASSAAFRSGISELPWDPCCCDTLID